MMIEQALKYIQQGWPVVPCNGKIPLKPNWPDISPDLETVTSDFADYPNANIAIITGPRSGLVVIDVDGDDGRQSLTALLQKYGDLPETLTAESGKGFHYYFRYPSGETIKNDTGQKLGKGIDVRGMGGCIVAPPSIHANGKQYKWLNEDTPVANLPTWLLEQLIQQTPSVNNKPIEMAVLDPKHERYARGALNKAYATIAQAAEGTRNVTLNDQSWGLGQLISAGVLGEQMAREVLFNAAITAGLTTSETKATINHGLEAGKKYPRKIQSSSKTISIGEQATSAISLETLKPKPNTISAKDLMNTEFSPLRWAIANLLPVGLTVLGGRPKQGKSWMAFSIALAVANGDKALGCYQTQKGDVLYLALEDSLQRLQTRLMILKEHDEDVPNTLHFACQWRDHENGGIDDLGHWLDNHPDARLIIIDTWVKFCASSRSRKGNDYVEESKALAKIQQFALQRNISVVVIHHNRKPSANSQTGDPIDEILGTTAFTGIPDTIWGLKRPRTEDIGELSVISRDLEDRFESLSFDQKTCLWTALEEPLVCRMSEERQKIWRTLNEHDEPLGPKAIAEKTGLSHDSVRQLVCYMEASEVIERKGRGKYTCKNRPSQDHNELKDQS
ncbi:MAG: bifunctional DNA primase/polymerase [Vampirovibrionales bacterium]|nr:bifunctional DNA primase/polymerase [Vampirovibrionales bacterium]